MSFTKKHGTGAKLFTFEIPENFDYFNLSELVQKNGIDTVYQVNAFYINTKGKFGDAPVIATNCELVNAPQHTLDVVKAALADGESVSLINGGFVGFKIYEYKNSYGVNYGVEWVDLVPE